MNDDNYSDETPFGQELDNGYEPDDSMDGDFDSAMASAGLGTDEDYEHNLIDDSMDDGFYGDDGDNDFGSFE